MCNWYGVLIMTVVRSAICDYVKCTRSSPALTEVRLDGEALEEITNVTISHTQTRTISIGTDAWRPTCVDLSSNRLENWPMVNHSQSILMLNLSHNQLNHWDEKVMSRLGALKTLDLSYNKISYIDITSLIQLKSLYLLYLQGNSVHIFSSLTEMATLDTVVLSTEHWYAINNIEFGFHPVNVIIEGNPMLATLKFQCTPTNQGYESCREANLNQIQLQTTPSNSCVVCFFCTSQENSMPSEVWSKCTCSLTAFAWSCMTLASTVCFMLCLYIGCHSRKYSAINSHGYICSTRLSRNDLTFSPIASIRANTISTSHTFHSTNLVNLHMSELD